MKIHFIVKSKKDIMEKEDFKKAIRSKIEEIITDHYWLKEKKFDGSVEVEEMIDMDGDFI